VGWIEELIGGCGGELSFRDFMELALYYPEHGYYSAEQPRYGRSGDFLTAPTASSWYSAVIGSWLARLATDSGRWTVVDLASGDGSFLSRLVEKTRTTSGPIFNRVVSVDRSASMRKIQAQRFNDLAVSIECHESLTSARKLVGPVFMHACELFDALPVHRVVAREEGLRELRVKVVEDRLEWSEGAVPGPVRDYLVCHRIELEPDQIAEVNLEARTAHHEALSAVGDEGVALTLDYGYPAQRLYNSRGRMGGTLACYRNHRMSRDPLEAPGQQDMTAHVNWDDLRLAASDAGWSEVGLWSLAELLIRAGLEQLVEERGLGMEADLDAATLTERQEIKRLLDPDGMGSDLKVLVQARGDIESVVRTSLGVAPESEESVG